MSKRTSVRELVSEECAAMRKNDRETARPGEQGFALVLALLALLLLTFLGLTLAVTTSTELQIATNYRWSRQAVYVAEAGIEAGKAVLRGVAWNQLVPPARVGAPWAGIATPAQAGGALTTWSANAPVGGLARRNFEGWQCDKKGDGMGYGVVLDETLGAPSGQVYQYVSTVLGQRLNGAFTLWVRRPLYIRPDGSLTDWGAVQTVPGPLGSTPADDDNLVLVAEGVAPYNAGASSTSLAQSRAVHVIEVAVSHIGTTTTTECDTSRGGQQGLGPEGANFGGCRKLTADALTDAMRGAGGSRGGLSDTGAQ
jgi:Tfp pilus assembly protein PilX